MKNVIHCRNTISTWSSGTGGAGIIGALVYAVLTEPHFANLSPKVTLLVMLVVPVVFAATYWFLLVVPESIHQARLLHPRTWIVPETSLTVSVSKSDDSGFKTSIQNGEGYALTKSGMVRQRKMSFKEMLLTTASLLRFMIPLMLVYFFEYLINQGIVQLVFYSCDNGWHLTRASQYRWYQLGVFISRSSINIVELPYWALVLLPILQFVNVVIFFFESLYFYIPHIWILFVVILFEGLFGGASYVNSFSHIHNFAKPDVREFAMSISSLGDAFGIVAAGFMSIPLHNYVCGTSLPKHLTE
ncbi:unnamed protein product [Gongylonema pulchrum]|uniref:Battenin n=1 Tax=Gongylonema pulchrum TaxID=637853 RepID=A0A3P7NJ16_9BILA|nr:unnamed protein product [Gongylonema pulchrum]